MVQDSSQSTTPAPDAILEDLRRLGKNVNGYLGETIDIESTLTQLEAAATTFGWNSEVFLTVQNLKLVAFKRISPHPGPRVYISAGIHGDEPAGPLALLQLLNENRWPDKFSLWLCPCLNPIGFALNRRENLDGTDLNREYLRPKAAEIVAHVEWLERQPRFDLCLCLHEDWEANGFYVYELNPESQRSMAPIMIASLEGVCPIDTSEIIEGRPAQMGIIRPNGESLNRPQWPEAFFLHSNKTRLSYTLEAPSDFPLKTRVAALASAVRATLDSFVGGTGSAA